MNSIGAQIVGNSAKDKQSEKSQPSEQASEAGKGAPGAAKVKVNISADTERGEAGIVAAGVAIPPSGIANKSNLAMAGGNILGDKSSFMKQKNQEAHHQTGSSQGHTGQHQ